MDRQLTRAAITSGSLILLIFLVALASARREAAADAAPRVPASAPVSSR